MNLVWSEIKNKVFATLAILLLLVSLGFGFATYHYKNESETQAVQITALQSDLKQANGFIDITKKNAENTSTISVKRQEDRKQITTVNTNTQEQLNAAIKKSPNWSNLPVPDGMFDSLKTE